MPRKHKQHIETGLDKLQLFGVILGGFFLFVVFIMMTITLPRDAGNYLYISTPIGIFGYVSLIWINIRPNLLGRLFVNMSISTLCGIMAFRAFDNLLPQFSLSGGVIIVIIGIFVYTFPIWNPSTANFIRGEMFAPKTKIGKIVFRASLALIPVVGIAGAMTETFLYRANKQAGISVILLFLGLLIIVVLPFSYEYPRFPWVNRDE
jgi:hypothetical protein